MNKQSELGLWMVASGRHWTSLAWTSGVMTVLSGKSAPPWTKRWPTTSMCTPSATSWRSMAATASACDAMTGTDSSRNVARPSGAVQPCSVYSMKDGSVDLVPTRCALHDTDDTSVRAAPPSHVYTWHDSDELPQLHTNSVNFLLDILKQRQQEKRKRERSRSEKKKEDKRGTKNKNGRANE